MRVTSHKGTPAQDSTARHGDSPNTAPLNLTVITSQERFQDLKPSWDRLASAAPELGPFARHEWFDALWPWAQQRGEPTILVFDKHGATIGIAPLLLRTTARPLVGHRVVELLQVPDTQFCDILTTDSDRPHVCMQLANWLAGGTPAWSCLELTNFPEESGTPALLSEALARLGIAVQVRAQSTNYYVDLSKRWDDYYGRLSRRLKKGNNLVANRLQKEGHLQLRWLRGEQITREVADQLVSLSAASWKTGTGTTFDNPGPKSFFDALVVHARKSGILSVWLLSLDATVLASEIQLIDGRCVYALRADYNVDASALSPGTYLNWQVLRSLFEEDLTRYYFGPGTNSYKLRWTKDGAPLRQIHAYSRSAPGRVLKTWDLNIRPVIRRLRNRFVKTSK